MTRDERLQAEMERGRHVAARAFNLDRIMRLLASKRLTIKTHLVTVRKSGATAERHEFFFDGALIYTIEGPLAGPEYPPEPLMALLGLTLQALDVEVPPPDPTHKVSEEGRRYKERLREVNAHRWGDQ